jgi:hypothetical protein
MLSLRFFFTKIYRKNFLIYKNGRLREKSVILCHFVCYETANTLSGVVPLTVLVLWGRRIEIITASLI